MNIYLTYLSCRNIDDLEKMFNMSALCLNTYVFVHRNVELRTRSKIPGTYSWNYLRSTLYLLSQIVHIVYLCRIFYI